MNVDVFSLCGGFKSLRRRCGASSPRSDRSRRCSPESRLAAPSARTRWCTAACSAPETSTASGSGCASSSTPDTSETPCRSSSSPERTETQWDFIYRDEGLRGNITNWGVKSASYLYLQKNYFTFGATNWETLFTTHFGNEPADREDKKRRDWASVESSVFVRTNMSFRPCEDIFRKSRHFYEKVRPFWKSKDVLNSEEEVRSLF